jgi:hypothetical protein
MCERIEEDVSLLFWAQEDQMFQRVWDSRVVEDFGGDGEVTVDEWA